MNSVVSFLRSKKLVPILVIYYSVGIVGMVLPVTRSLFQSLTPLSLLMSIALLFIYHEPHSRKFWFLSIIIFAAGFGLEVLGVTTGLLFGAYTYGETLGLKLFHTPLMIGVNWLLLVYCSLTIVGKFIDSIYFRAVVAAALMVVYDFALEPAAIYTGMWEWEGGAVPMQNYVAWFLIGFVLNYVAARFRLVARENKIAQPLFFIQFGFFIALDIWIFAEKIWDF